MTASNHAFSAFSFISFVLTSIPFAWHLQGELPQNRRAAYVS